MKGLKKLALATAVAAAPFAQAEMTAMDDSLLAEMTGQAGITIDVDLQMTIDAIKYVDDDGQTRAELDLNNDGLFDGPDEGALVGVQGAITAKTLKIGSIDSGTGALSTAQIRGVTIDADGSQGLTIGMGKIGDELGNGIDISVDAVLINNGNANLNAFNTAANTTYSGGNSFTYAQYQSGDAQQAVVGTFVSAEVGAYALTVSDAAAEAAGYIDGDDLRDKLNNGSAAEQGAASVAVVTMAGAELGTGTPSSQATALATEAQDLGKLSAAGASIASAGAGNVGGIIIEDFRNYIQDDMVAKYNGIFDMALNTAKGVKTSTTALRTTEHNDAKTAAITPTGTNSYTDYADLQAQASTGAGDQAETDAQADLAKVNAGTDAEITSDVAAQNALAVLNNAANEGRYVRGEISIAGTGTYGGNTANSTGGLAIKGKFGGALDKAAWVDHDGNGGGNEFGVKDLGFFHGVDSDNDGISDTIEGMHFEMNIDVVEHTSAVETGVQVSALAISDMKMDGTIMMGNIYLGGTNTQERSLGSVLVKDINMEGTTVYIYGH